MFLFLERPRVERPTHVVSVPSIYCRTGHGTIAVGFLKPHFAVELSEGLAVPALITAVLSSVVGAERNVALPFSNSLPLLANWLLDSANWFFDSASWSFDSPRPEFGRSQNPLR